MLADVLAKTYSRFQLLKGKVNAALDASSLGWCGKGKAHEEAPVMEKALYKGLSDKVLGCLFKVHNALGPGLLESAYEAACIIEFRHEGLHVEQHVVFPLFYRGEMAGMYIADVVIEKKRCQHRWIFSGIHRFSFSGFGH